MKILRPFLCVTLIMTTTPFGSGITSVVSSKCPSQALPLSFSQLGLAKMSRIIRLRGGSHADDNAVTICATPSRNKTIALFDIDGTLTEPRRRISPEMRAFLRELRKHVTVGVIGGSDVCKAIEQLGEDYLETVDWAFAENGLVAYRAGKLIGKRSLVDHWGEASLQHLINWILRYLSEIQLPVKRGTFIEFRTGMLNVSPIGRSCTQTERDEFEDDKHHGIRTAMAAALRERWGHELGLSVAIGGQISMDIYPTGWDKSYCLRYLEPLGFECIHFFGDKTSPGGNDHEIWADGRTVAHTVAGPAHTAELASLIFHVPLHVPPHTLGEARSLERVNEAAAAAAASCGAPVEVEEGAGGPAVVEIVPVGEEEMRARPMREGEMFTMPAGEMAQKEEKQEDGRRRQQWEENLEEMLDGFRGLDPTRVGSIPEDELRESLTTRGDEPMTHKEVDDMLAEAWHLGCLDGSTRMFQYEQYIDLLRQQ